jgi:hypothetical protein
MEVRTEYKILVGKPEGERLLGIYTRRWEDNLRMGLMKRVLGAWTGFIWLRLGIGGGFLYTR